MKSELYFGLRLKYLRTEYEPLMRLTIVKPIYNYESLDYLWVFRYSDIEKVEAIVGTIEVPGLREEFKKQEVPTQPFKGIDFRDIKEFPKIYQVTEHRKVEDPETEEISVKEFKHNVDKVLVGRIWENVVLRQPLNRKVRTSTVAENICRELGITRFNRDSGTFQFDKFFGSRSDYLQYFYWPIKILCYKGCIIHHKNGMIEKI